MKANFPRTLMICAMLGIFATPAMAYIDPGAGSIAIQLLIAACIGGIYRVRAWFAVMANYVRRLFGKDC